MNCFILKKVLAVLVTLFLAKQAWQAGKGEDVGSILIYNLSTISHPRAPVFLQHELSFRQQITHE